MEQDKPNEYEEMMKSDEDFEEDVVEEESDPLEKSIDDEIKKVGTIKSEKEIKEEDVVIEEQEEIKEEPEVEEISTIEEEPEVEEISTIEEEPEVEEELNKFEKKKELEVKKKKSKTKPIRVSINENAKKRRVVAKKSRVKKDLINKKVIATVAAKKDPTKKRKTSLFPVAYSIAGVAIIILAIFLLAKTTPTVTAAAVINGEEISINDLDKEYEFFFLMNLIPEEYKQQLTKETFLNNILILEKLMLAEAEKNNIQVTEEEVDTFYRYFMEQTGRTIEVMDSTLTSLGFKSEDGKEYFKKQLIMFTLYNKTLWKDIQVSDLEIKKYYDANQKGFDSQNRTFEEVKEGITRAILTGKKGEVREIYMKQLVQNSEIEIYYPEDSATPLIIEDSSSLEEEGTEEFKEETDEELIEEVLLSESTVEIATFSETGDSLCKEEGRPILRMYSGSQCTSCKWVKETFEGIAKEYLDLEKVTVYHWELDTADNKLTAETETAVPRLEIELFQKYNPEGFVPTFVFGCKYFRVGNGYEAENNLAAEEAEFRAVIHSLI